MSRSAAKVLSVTLLLGLVGMGLVLSAIPSAPRGGPKSALSVQPNGRRIAFLLFDELGCQPELWTRAPGQLPSGEHVLFLPKVPAEAPGYRLADAADGQTDGLADGLGQRPVQGRRSRDPLHYLRFMQQGGTLVVSLTPAMEAFLAERLGLACCAQLERSEPESGQPTAVLLFDGTELTVGGVRGHLGTSRDEDGFEVLASDANGAALLVFHSVGRGGLAVFAGDDVLSNVHLEAHDNALFLVRAYEAIERGGRLLVDEYALGGWVPDGPAQLALSPRLVGLSAHLLALFTLLLWALAWVGPFARDPQPWSQLSALDRARALARVLKAGGQWNLLAQRLRDGVLLRLTGARAPRAHRTGDWGARPLTPDEVGHALARLGRRLPGAEERRGAADVFRELSVASEQELDAWSRELARIEQGLLSQES